jgi:hypothetical protein
MWWQVEKRRFSFSFEGNGHLFQQLLVVYLKPPAAMPSKN